MTSPTKLTYLTAEDIRDALPVKPSIRTLRKKIRDWPGAIELRNRPLLPAKELDRFLTSAFAARERGGQTKEMCSRAKSLLDEQREILAFLKRKREQKKSQEREALARLRGRGHTGSGELAAPDPASKDADPTNGPRRS